MSIFKIAVTGSAGSGKSLVCKRFFELGLKMFDCDQIARQVVEPGEQAYNDVVDLFGRNVVQKDGSLDRSKLRKIISNDIKMRKSLENIIHPALLDTLSLSITKSEEEGERAVIVEVPLLFESGLKEKFEFIITVACQDKDLVARITKRDKVSEKDARDMLSIQASQKEKIKKSDFVIWNTLGIDELKVSVDNLYQKIKKEHLT